MWIISLLVVGLIVGALARLLVPGSDPMGILATILLGVVGSFVGGFLGNLLFEGEFQVTSAGIIGSTIGAIITLLVFRSLRARRHVV